MWKFVRKGHSMLKGIWGKKIGMTQVFSEAGKVVPVTAINLDNWFVTQIKTQEADGYEAVQLGLVRTRYEGKPFEAQWLKKPKQFFLELKEVKLESAQDFNLKVGDAVDFASMIEQGKLLDVFGITIGKGFQGVVKRHGFSGGRASHGPRFGRIPGSLSFMRSQGRVIKNKKLPGHMGVQKRVMKHLEIVQIEPQSKIVLIKGSVPGGAGSLVYMQKV